MRAHLVAVLSTLLLISPSVLHAAGTRNASAAPVSQLRPFTYEFYYKIKWGHLDEFLELYKKNHYPILRQQKARGEILDMFATFPINHSSEDSRWDFRMTVVYRDAVIAHEDISELPWVKALYPDQATLKREEQQRFELLLEHTDIPICTDHLETW